MNFKEELHHRGEQSSVWYFEHLTRYIDHHLIIIGFSNCFISKLKWNYNNIGVHSTPYFYIFAV